MKSVGIFMTISWFNLSFFNGPLTPPNKVEIKKKKSAEKVQVLVEIEEEKPKKRSKNLVNSNQKTGKK